MGVNARRGVDRRAKKRALFAVPIGFFGIVLLTLVGVKGQGTAWAAANGAHAKHSAYPCQSCHVWHLGPSNWFEKGGLAYIKPSDSNPSPPLPTFDAVTQTCLNVACHSVPEGTYSYIALDDVEYFANYGRPSRPTPSWYAEGIAACTACHDNPPRNGSDGSNAWHSGWHANVGAADYRNQCQLCHPDATGTNGKGETITNPSLHRNGKVEVQKTWTAGCRPCHW